MITGQSPFGGEDEEQLFDSIQNSEIPFSRFLDQYTSTFLNVYVEWEGGEEGGGGREALALVR